MTILQDYGHQGDLNFRKVEAIPEGTKDITESLLDRERDGYLLALGEHTNHAHVLIRAKKSSIQIMEQNGRRYLVIDGAPVKLLHGTFVAPAKIKEVETDRHADIVLPPGIYEQNFELGYDPFIKKIKQVQD